jgi:hypothetical protein
MQADARRRTPTAWQYVGTRPPTDLVDARLQLHWAAQLVSAVGTTLLPAAADDSHTNLEWLTAPALLAGGRTAETPRCRAALRPADLHLLLLDANDAAIAEHALNGMTLSQGLVWLEQEIAALGERPLPKPLRRRALDLPDHAVGRGAPFRATDAAALTELGRWYANGDAVLRAVAGRTPHATPVRCWPHHFDIATLVTVEADVHDTPVRTIGIGLSPGDASYAEPYWYVTPWPRPDDTGLPALDGDGAWHRTGWLGAVLTGSRVATQAASEAQARLVNTFLAAAVDACRTLLQPRTAARQRRTP